MSGALQIDVAEAFEKELLLYVQDFEGYLGTDKKYSRQRTANRIIILKTFIEFIIRYKAVAGFEDITKATLRSSFAAYVSSQHEDLKEGFTNAFLIRCLKEFFTFVYLKYKITTPVIRKEFAL